MKQKRQGSSSQAGAVCLGIAVILTSICARSGASQSITLGWNAETNTTAVGYALYYGTNSGSFTSNYMYRVDAGTNITATVSNLAAGNIYYFAITAYNSQHVESAPSPPISFLVPGLLTLAPPSKSAPATITFAVASNHTYTVQASTNLITWTNIGLVGTASSNALVTFHDTNSGSFKKRFYRLSISTLVPSMLTLALPSKIAPATITFQVASNHTYIVQASTNLITWTNIGQLGIATSNALVSFQDTNSGLFNRRFYRLTMSP